MDDKTTRKALASLEQKIDRYYHRHSAKRVAGATVLVGVLSVGISLAVYALSGNLIWSIASFGLVSLLGVNVAMFCIVPPTSRLDASKDFVLGAVINPERIESVVKNKVRLADDKGRARSLDTVERGVWDSVVMPYLLNSKAPHTDQTNPEKAKSPLKAGEKQSDKESALEVRERALERRMQEIEAAEADLAARSKYLDGVEKSLVERLNALAEREASVEQSGSNAGVRAD